MMGNEQTSFYEDDEPVEKIVAAFERGDKQMTRAPSLGFNLRVKWAGLLAGINQTAGRAV